MTRESYEDYMKRRSKEADAEYEERRWKEFEKHTELMRKQTERKFDERGERIFESPDGGKTVYERAFGSNIRRIVTAPEEQKINDYLNKNDMVNHPPHYNKGIETTKYIDSWDMGFAQGNVIKYVTRYNLKHEDKQKQLEDLKKARWYLDDLINMVENS